MGARRLCTDVLPARTATPAPSLAERPGVVAAALAVGAGVSPPPCLHRISGSRTVSQRGCGTCSGSGTRTARKRAALSRSLRPFVGRAPCDLQELADVLRSRAESHGVQDSAMVRRSSSGLGILARSCGRSRVLAHRFRGDRGACRRDRRCRCGARRRCRRCEDLRGARRALTSGVELSHSCSSSASTSLVSCVGSALSWPTTSRPARARRTTWLKGVALVVAFISLTINFGLIDLIDGFTGYVDQARNQILDVGWGAVFGLIVPIGVLSQLRRPERRIAGIQQTVVVAVTLALAGAAGQRASYFALAGAIAVASTILVALHPARRTFLVRTRPADRMMLALALVAAGPTLVYAWRMASAQRNDLPPADAVTNESSPLDRDDDACAPGSFPHASRRRLHAGLASSGAQRVHRSSRMGDLMPARSDVRGGQRRAYMGVGDPHVGRRRVRRLRLATNAQPHPLTHDVSAGIGTETAGMGRTFPFLIPRSLGHEWRCAV